ncbi:MAG: hypothetical protein RID81_02955 [Sandaracinaceae bacterium]
MRYLARYMVVALAVGSAGCAPNLGNLANLSAGRIGCAARDITVTEAERQDGWNRSTYLWRAECSGAFYRCTHEATQVSEETSCVVERTSGGSVAATPTDAPAVTAAPRIAEDPAPEVQRSVDNSGRVRLDVTLPSADASVEIGGDPLSESGEMSLAVTGLPVAGNEECPIQLMVDGELQPVSPTRFERTETAHRWTALVDIDVLRRVANGVRVFGRVCSAELRFDESSRHAIAELVARYDEERAFAAGVQ